MRNTRTHEHSKSRRLVQLLAPFIRAVSAKRRGHLHVMVRTRREQGKRPGGRRGVGRQQLLLRQVVFLSRLSPRLKRTTATQLNSLSLFSRLQTL